MKIPVLNKEFQLVIPTHGRCSYEQQKTWRSLPQEMREQTLVITSTRQDMKRLRTVLDHSHVYAVDDQSVDGIAKKRQWLIENIRADYIFQLDDDLTFQHRCPKRMRYLDDKGTWKMLDQYKDKKFIRVQEFSEKQKLQAWEMMFARISNYGYAHGGLAPRMGNNNEKGEYRINGRVMQAMFHHRRTLLKKGVRFDALKFREDFHVNLSLLRLGYPNFVNARFIVNADPFGKKGGCSDERSIEESNRQAFLLEKMHTPFVKAAHRKYAESSNVPRVEVTCFWQKAYNSAKKQERYV